jgi:hypothetical protein
MGQPIFFFRHFFLLLSLLLCVTVSSRASAQSPSQNASASPDMVITHRAPEIDGDTRPNYEVSVLRLALDKTPEYGPYRLQPAPRINVTRSLHSIRTNAFPNFFYSLGYEEKYNHYPEMTYLRFPVDLGLLGFRTCFIPSAAKDQIAKVNTLDDLRKLSIVQGRGWVDVEILRSNGLKVTEIDRYDTMFKMTAAHRFDLFCRGASEIQDEYKLWKDLPGFDYDRHLLIQYPLPIFFYTNKNNTLAIERITKGLERAYADGTLHKLWAREYASAMAFTQLRKRHIIKLNNPLLKSIDTRYEKYQFDLETSDRATLEQTEPSN